MYSKHEELIRSQGYIMFSFIETNYCCSVIKELHIDLGTVNCVIRNFTIHRSFGFLNSLY